MKKLAVLTIIIFFTGLTYSFAQTPVVNPIPSFNYQMDDPSALFHENKIITSTNREKRDMDVVVNTRSTWSFPVFAIVFVFKINPMKIQGPYIVFPGVQLSVPIDNGKWGVLVQGTVPLDVSVWID